MSKVYEIVQKRILERLEEAIKKNEKFEWVKPWKETRVPKNFITKKTYRGINLLLLPMGGYYLTMKQVNDLGGKVIKDSKASQVYFWTYIVPKNKELSEEEKEEALAVANNESDSKKIPVFKYYNVFHQSQIEGIDFGKEVDVDTVVNEEHTLNMDAEEIINLFGKEVKINTTEWIEVACYSPSKDEIFVPHNSKYYNIEEYYNTVLHEMIHSTGHSSRLNRFHGSCKFGDNAYSREELVAEIGSSMMRAYLGINHEDTDANSIAYLKAWYDTISNGNANTITYAAQQAQKAMDYILEKVESNKLLLVS